MDSKLRKKISIILCVAVVVIAIAATGIFFGVRSIQNRHNLASNTSSVQLSPEILTNSANEAIARGKVSKNFDGDYIFYRLGYIEFLEDKDKICAQMGVEDPNGLFDYMSNLANEQDETGGGISGKTTRFAGKTISLEDGNYTVNRNKYLTSEAGTYVGDDNLSVLIDTEGNATNTYISLHYLNKTCTESSEKYQSTGNPQLINLYVIKTVSNKYNTPLFTVTYIFKLQVPELPDMDYLPDI